MIKLKSKEEIEILKEGGQKLAGILNELKKEVRPGITTLDLEKIAVDLIAESGGEGAFFRYKPAGATKPFPANLCVSLNEEIVHGIPGETEIMPGDVVSLDLGIKYKGLITDHAITIAVEPVSPRVKKLLEVTEEALKRGIAAAQPGFRTGDIGEAIEKYVKKEGFGIVRDLAGHGVGYSVHEDPSVPNYGKAGEGEELLPGTVIAIEPMITMGSEDIDVLPDDWTIITADGSLSAHFEHTIVVTEDGPEIITKLD